MKRVQNRGLFIAFALLTVVAACTKLSLYERYYDIKGYEWNWQDKKTFTVNISDTNSLYNLYVNVRHTAYYPYNNIWVKISTRFPDGTHFEKRVELPLADVKEGKWYGEGMGDISDAQIALQQNMFFSKTGVYVFEIEQNMRQDRLQGVMSIGLRLEDTHKARIDRHKPTTPGKR